jgi:hypothetical protein
MGYRDRGNGYKGNPAWVGVVVAVVLLGRCVLMPLGAVGSHATATAATVESDLLDDPKTGMLFATIKRTYPEEFDGLTRDVVQRTNAGASPSELQDAVLTYVIAAGRRHGKDIVQAPHQAFDAYRKAEIRVVEALQATDPDLCDQYLSKGSFRSETHHVDDQVLIDFRTTTWETSAAGRDSPANRVVVQPDVKLWREIAANMSATGLNQRKVDTFFDQKAMAALLPRERCEIGLGFLRAVENLPGDKGDMFYAFLASRPA